MKDFARRVDRQVGERIRARRAELGLTQEDLARALGISYQQVQKYETGGNRISAGRLFEIAQRLGAPVGYFFEGLPEAPLEAAEDKRVHGGTQRALIELVQNFNAMAHPRVRTAVSGLMKSLAAWPPVRRGESEDE